ncbi:MAG TPA: hypothetical protein VF074_23565, partial [Pyrinomonadaceae bacterium]
MTTADKSQDEKTPLFDESAERQDAAEVIFPAIERNPPVEEPEALISSAVSEETVVTSPKKQNEKTQARAPRKRKWILLLAGLILVAASISIFFYLQNRPKPVPTPTSVDLQAQTSTTTTEMPETAFQITPEKQQLIGVQYGTVEYQTISKSLRAV